MGSALSANYKQAKSTRERKQVKRCQRWGAWCGNDGGKGKKWGERMFNAWNHWKDGILWAWIDVIPIDFWLLLAPCSHQYIINTPLMYSTIIHQPTSSFAVLQCMLPPSARLVGALCSTFYWAPQPYIVPYSAHTKLPDSYLNSPAQPTNRGV